MEVVRSRSPFPLGQQKRRYVVEEAEDGIFWPPGSLSINSPLVAKPDDLDDPQVPRAADGGHIEAGKQSSFGISVFNLMNAILGSGILGLSFAMAKSGIVLFTMLLIAVAAMADFSIHLLLKMCTLTGVKSYEEVGLFAFKVPGKIMAATAILLQNIGSMSSYLFIVKDELPQIISTFFNVIENKSIWYLNGTYLLLMVVVIVILPLACLPKIGFLGYTSGLSILCMVFFTVVVVIKKFSFPCPVPGNHTHADINYTTSHYTSSLIGQNVKVDQVWTNHNTSSECKPTYLSLTIETAYALPTMAFSFVCHTAILPIYCKTFQKCNICDRSASGKYILEFDDLLIPGGYILSCFRPTKTRMQRVANTSMIISFILYMISALFGYLTFYGSVSSELLDGYQAYDPDDLIILIVRIAVCVAIIFTIPLVHYPARKALLMIFSTWAPLRTTSFPWLRHFVATAMLITLVTCIAVFVPNIKQIFGIVGASASTSLVFILPSIFYLRLGTEPLKSVKKIACVGLLVIGVTNLVISLTAIIYGIVNVHT